MIYRLRTFDDPILKQRCDQTLRVDDLSFIDAMKSACRQFNGCGLAAPQIGVAKRVIIIMPGKSGRCETMINPVIMRTSEEMLSDKEGCLSYPEIKANVIRHKWIEFAYFDTNWKGQRAYRSEWEARIVQHEIDHLNGICRVGDAWRGTVPKK